MGEGSATGKDAKGKAKAKAPAAASAPVVARDDAYLEAVTQKRVRMFEDIQARQALERLNIGGEVINIVWGYVLQSNSTRWRYQGREEVDNNPNGYR
jgi:hypothetical protein